MDTYPRLRKYLVVGIMLLFVGVNISLGANPSCIPPHLPRVIQHHIQATSHDIIGQTSLDSNVLLSSNTGNDFHPRMTTNNHGHTIVV